MAVGGALGAVCRYVVDFAISERLSGVFPWGTWTVNISGSLLLGVLTGASAGASGDATLWRTAAASGFCGAFTTFSTFMYETLQLIERRAWRLALWNLASLAVGVGAAALGWWLGALGS
jgi:CrcB protein